MTKREREEAEMLATIDAGLAENVRLGFMVKAGKNSEGQQLYRMTKKGDRAVEKMLAAPPPAPKEASDE